MKYIIGIVVIVSLMILWVMIQHFWRVIFIGQETTEDVLAKRSHCGSCGCGTLCENKKKVMNQKH